MKPTHLTAQDRIQAHGASALNDHELLTVVLGPTAGANNTAKAAAALLDTAPLQELAWAQTDELCKIPGVGPARAAAIAAAFELGRRSGWSPPRRGDRLLDPSRVYELLKHVAHAEQEQFHIVCLDVRGRLLKSAMIAQGSLHQCPVSPREVLRQALRVNSHSVVLAHSHPSGSVSPSPDDLDLTERLRAALELAGIGCRDHVIVGTEGYYSFVEAGRWRR